MNRIEAMKATLERMEKLDLAQAEMARVKELLKDATWFKSLKWNVYLDRVEVRVTGSRKVNLVQLERHGDTYRVGFAKEGNGFCHTKFVRKDVRADELVATIQNLK